MDEFFHGGLKIEGVGDGWNYGEDGELHQSGAVTLI